MFDLRPEEEPDVDELCPACMGEGAHDAEGTPRFCTACLGTGHLYPVAALIRRLYRRHAHQLTSDERGHLAKATDVCARLEVKDQCQIPS